MSERNELIFRILTGQSFSNFDDELIPRSLPKLRAWLDELEQQVPAEFRDSIQIELSSNTYYDSSQIELEVNWSRPETDDEVTARQIAEDHRVNTLNYQEEARERATLAALKAKYGS